MQETTAGAVLAWTSVTTGNLAGVDLWIDDAHGGTQCCSEGRNRADAGAAASGEFADLKRATDHIAIALRSRQGVY